MAWSTVCATIPVPRVRKAARLVTTNTIAQSRSPDEGSA